MGNAWYGIPNSVTAEPCCMGLPGLAYKPVADWLAPNCPKPAAPSPVTATPVKSTAPSPPSPKAAAKPTKSYVKALCSTPAPLTYRDAFHRGERQRRIVAKRRAETRRDLKRQGKRKSTRTAA